MSEYLRAPKYVAAIIATGIGLSALSGCAESSPQTWEIGVVCPDKSRAQVGSLDTDPYIGGDNDAKINVLCVSPAGVDIGSVTSMELTKGQGAIINTNKTYTDTIEIKYEDQRDGYTPEIDMDALTGYISTDNVKIQSVAVTN